MNSSVPQTPQTLKLVRSALKFAAQRFEALPRFTEPQIRYLVRRITICVYFCVWTVEGLDIAARGLSRQAEVMELRTHPAGGHVIKQGATDDSYYVLVSGECNVVIDGNTVGKVSPGSGFGEVALTLDTRPQCIGFREYQCLLLVIDHR